MAIDPERLKLLDQLKGQLGGLQQQPTERPVSPIAGVAQRIGLPLPTTPTIGGKLVGAAIEETKPPEIGEREARLKAKGEVLKLGEKARANFGRAVGMFSTLVAQAKGMGEEQKQALQKFGIETTGLGLLPGAVGGAAVATRRPGFGRTAAFRGQQKETAISLNSILTGQNRVIRSVVRMIQETLPTTNDPEDIMATKLAQSIMNAYRLVKAFQKAGLTPAELEQKSDSQLDDIDARSLIALYTLTPREEEEIERVTQDVLGTPAMPGRTFEEFGEEEAVREMPGVEGISEEDIQFTMQKHGLSREEVLQRMRQ